MSINKFHCDNIVLRDELNRQRIFRGINICVKSRGKDDEKIREWGKSICSDEYIDRLLKNGINLVRVGLTWELIEPEENKFNRDFIDIFKTFAEKCREKDIYIFLDMHQDCFSNYCSKPWGDGAPEWAVPADIKPEHHIAIWAEGYFYMNGVQKAFRDFWHNENHIQDKFVKAWRFYASEFEQLDNVIGYDYLNEPFIEKDGRNVFLNLLENVVKLSLNKTLDLKKNFINRSAKAGFVKSVLQIAFSVKSIKKLKYVSEFFDNKENFGKTLEGFEKYTDEFNSKYYAPFFSKMCKEVNETSALNFFEHNYYSNLGIPFSIDCTDEKSVYSPHAYDLFIDSPLYNKYSSDARVEHILDNVRANQLKMNVPVIFGEYGGGSNGTQWLKHIDYIIGQFEKYQWSNAYWGIDFENELLLDVLNRPYPVAVNGNIVEYKTNSSQRTFTLTWTQDNTDAKTIVYIPGEKGMTEYDGQIGENKIEIKY